MAIFTDNLMAINDNILEERLAQVEARAQRILAAAEKPVDLPGDNEQWWPFLVNHYGSEARMFEKCGVDRRVFDEVYALVSNTPGQGRGRRGSSGQTGRSSCFS